MQEKIKIVIVDEQHDYRNSCAERLSELGYEIAASTSNPIKALDIIKETQPDVVLFDIVLSPIDGIAFLRSCASLQKKPHMIAVSSIISDIVIRESMQYGAEYYIIKPFDFNILDERIKRMCGRSSFPAWLMRTTMAGRSTVLSTSVTGVRKRASSPCVTTSPSLLRTMTQARSAFLPCSICSLAPATIACAPMW